MTGFGLGCLGSYLTEGQEDILTETETVTGSGLGCLGSYLTEGQEDTPTETGTETGSPVVVGPSLLLLLRFRSWPKAWSWSWSRSDWAFFILHKALGRMGPTGTTQSQSDFGLPYPKGRRSGPTATRPTLSTLRVIALQAGRFLLGELSLFKQGSLCSTSYDS